MFKKLERLFENPGLKIKKCAKIFFVIECIATIITAIVCGVEAYSGFFVFLLIFVCGILASFLANLTLYAAGEVVENISIIKDNTTHFQPNHEKILEPKQTETKQTETKQTETKQTESKQIKPVSTPVQNTASNNKKECPNCGAKNNLSNATCWACNHELE